ncbi:MAG: ABC transporter permease [Hyphomicrobiaceae bacterium]
MTEAAHAVPDTDARDGDAASGKGGALTSLSGAGELRKIIVIFLVTTLVVGIPAALFMRWYWLDPEFTTTIGSKPQYMWLLFEGIWRTIWLLVLSCVFGMLLAIPIGLVQVTGPRWLAMIAKGFCTIIRGTPLLIQLWLLYFGFGSLFPSIPGIRESFLWPILIQAWPYALFAFILSFAGYEGEIMRGAFAGVPKGELEAGRAYGMSRFKLLRRIWLPRAVHQALPTLSGEVVLQLKSTPLAATVTVFDVFGVAGKIRQDLYIVYEPLLFVALIYGLLTLLIVLLFRWLETRVPIKR